MSSIFVDFVVLYLKIMDGINKSKSQQIGRDASLHRTMRECRVDILVHHGAR